MIRIYSDESSLKERHFLLGAVWVESDTVIEAVRRLRIRNAPTGGKKTTFEGEFKWQKVSTKHLGIYEELVDIFFDALKNKDLRYACLLWH